MQDYESYKEKYGDKTSEELQESLLADDSDWIQVDKPIDFREGEAFTTPGSFKIVNHVGKDNRKFFALQNLEKNGVFFQLFEVLGANKL